MKSKTKRRITLATLSCFCLSALACGVGPFIDAAMRASAEGEETENTVYTQNFESLSGASTAEEIATASGWTGGARSISESEGLYVNIPYIFDAYGWSNITMWDNAAPVLETGAEYTVTTRFRPYGNYKSMAFGIYQSSDNAGTSVSVAPTATTINKIEAGPLNGQLISATKSADGWWDISFNATGAGQKNYFRYVMSVDEANIEAVNANKSIGLDWAELKIEKKETGDVVHSIADKITPDLEGNFVWTAFTWDDGKSSVGDSVKIAGIEGKSLKAVYSDFESDGTASDTSKISLAKTDTLYADTKYTIEFDVAALGNVDEINLAFKQSDASSVLNSGIVKLSPADHDYNTDNGGNLFVADSERITYNSATGVYHVREVLLGMGGGLEISAGLKAANRIGETGLYLDNITLAENVFTPTMGLKKTTWNSASPEDMRIAVNFESVTSVKLGETALTAGSDYTLADGILTIKSSALAEVADGDHTLTVTIGNKQLTAAIRVIQAPMANVYETDFATLIDLVEDLSDVENHSYRKNNTPFYQNSSFNPGDWDVSISTADFEDGHGRAVRFRPTKKTDCMLFQTNPGAISGMEANKWNTISLDVKPENGATSIKVDPIVFNDKGTAWTNGAPVTINVVENTSANNNANVGWSVTPLANGWYRLSVSFFIAESRTPQGVYVRFSAAREQGEFGTDSSSWCVDNVVVEKEMIPSYVRGNGIYDLGADTATYYLLDLCGDVYDIVSVKLGAKTLVKDTDYTLPAVPGAYIRLQLTDSFREQYELGFEGTIMLETSRKNTVLELPFKVSNTKPLVPAAAVKYDIAADLSARKGAVLTADLLGYELASISYNGEDLLGSEFNYDAAAKTISFKQSYLKSLAVGNHVYTVNSATGSSATFTLTISDTRPAFGAALSYDKKTSGDFTLDLDLFGRDLVSVVLNGTTLTNENYTYAGGKLTLKESVVSAFIAGEYDLTVTTIVAVTVKIAVVDVPPVISSTNVTAKQNADLVLDVTLSNKAIVSITVGGLPLTDKDYTCADGKLTIKSDVLGELALGEKQIVLQTEGGTATLTFTLAAAGAEEPEPEKNGGCNSSVLSGSLLGLVLVGAAAAVVVKKKKD